MQHYWQAAAIALTVTMASGQASACMSDDKINLNDVRYASVVVVGQLSHYEIILDPVIRKELGERTGGFMSDYARFNVQVEEVLAGKAPHNITVTWDNSTFEEPPTMAPGRYLLALRDPSSPIPPLRGPSATILANPEPQSLTLLQAPCSSPFLFPIASKDAASIRKKLAASK